MLLVNMFVGYANNHVDNVKYDFVVATDGTGNYTTVQAAINDIPEFRKAGPTRMIIKRGV